MLTRRSFLKSALSLAILPVTGALSSTLFAAGLKHQAVEHIVNIQSFAFVHQLLVIEEQLAVKVGDTITWINQDIVPHTATAVDSSWDTGLIEAGAKVSLQVTKGWGRDYYCIYHPKMLGELLLVNK
ncbi:MAG: hypothetical protein V7784_13170 [Oceanospirillaceae bacterium]